MELTERERGMLISSIKMILVLMKQSMRKEPELEKEYVVLKGKLEVG
jgi:hypothetical protein